jgi:hypothetical protein
VGAGSGDASIGIDDSSDIGPSTSASSPRENSSGATSATGPALGV